MTHTADNTISQLKDIIKPTLKVNEYGRHTITTDDKTIDKLAKCFKLIERSHLNIASSTSIENGEGISVYKFLTYPPMEETGANCYYLWYPRGSDCWNTLFNASPEGPALLKQYDPSKNFLVFVSVPVYKTRDDDSRGSIKLYPFNNNKNLHM